MMTRTSATASCWHLHVRGGSESDTARPESTLQQQDRPLHYALPTKRVEGRQGWRGGLTLTTSNGCESTPPKMPPQAEAQSEAMGLLIPADLKEGGCMVSTGVVEHARVPSIQVRRRRGSTRSAPHHSPTPHQLGHNFGKKESGERKRKESEREHARRTPATAVVRWE